MKCSFAPCFVTVPEIQFAKNKDKKDIAEKKAFTKLNDTTCGGL
jgi:hypothetical protein